jgi:hypothetical protein
VGVTFAMQLLPDVQTEMLRATSRRSALRCRGDPTKFTSLKGAPGAARDPSIAAIARRP